MIAAEIFNCQTQVSTRCYIFLKKELFNLRFQHAINQLEDPMRLKAVRKQIAVVKTIQEDAMLAAQETMRALITLNM